MIKISGVDAKKFLQGQITINMDELQPNKAMLAAHCHRDGRIISLFHIVTFDDAYYLILPTSMTDIAINAFKKYSVFFKVTIEDASASTIDIILPDKINRIQSGIPAIYPDTSGKFLPHELNLDKLNAISFNKGCYTGQEIIARMHYRGKLKKHLYLGQTTTTEPPAPATSLYSNINDEMEMTATIIDSVMDNSDHCLILFVCDESNAKNNHLYLEGGRYVTIINHH